MHDNAAVDHTIELIRNRAKGPFRCSGEVWQQRFVSIHRYRVSSAADFPVVGVERDQGKQFVSRLHEDGPHHRFIGQRRQTY
jgi:hypothetical protein